MSFTKLPDIYIYISKEIMEENFKHYEKRERKALNHYFKIKGIDTFSDINHEEAGNFSTYDSIFKSGSTIITAEVKIREFKHDKYPTIILEMDKVNRLFKEFLPKYVKDKRNRLLYYAFYRGDRKLLIFDLMNTPSTNTIELCPKTTAGNSEMVFKAMCNFTINNAIEKINY